MRYRLIPLIVLASALLYACGDNPQPQGPTPTPTGPAPGGRTITYQTTGGIEGVRRELVITPEGFATLTDRGVTYGPLALPANRIAEINAKLASSNFQDLEERYGTGTVSDDFYHTLTVADGSSTKSVTMEEVGGKDVTPAPVQELFTLMGEVEDEVRELATTTPTPAPASYVGPLIFRSVREGTGEEWEMSITEEGEATILDAGKELGKVQLPQAQLDGIHALLEDADFFDLKAYYGAGWALPNDRVFTINLQAGGKRKIVSMEDHGSVNVTPQSVINLFNKVSGLYVGSRAQLLGTPVAAP